MTLEEFFQQTPAAAVAFSRRNRFGISALGSETKRL